MQQGSSRTRRAALAAACIAVAGAAAAAQTKVAPGAPAGIVGTPGPADAAATRLAVTPVVGSEDMFFVGGAYVANLDRGRSYLAGTTLFQLTDFVWLEARLSYLWSPRGGASAFTLPPELFFTRNRMIPTAIADDGTVVGFHLYLETGELEAYRWTDAGGLEYLPLPGPLSSAQALTVSRDGDVIAGFLRDPGIAAQRAALWEDGALTVLGSDLHGVGWRLSADGSVLVGEEGPDPTLARAARWVGGVPSPLQPVPGATSSTARLVSDDGEIAVGWADVGGIRRLVRWDAAGAAEVHVPPDGLEVDSLNAINPDATAVVGSLDGEHADVVIADDRVPFLWREGEGFVLLDEIGMESDYDFSEARDVSDDGRVVIGDLKSLVIFNGFPPAKGFLWTEERGTVTLDDLFALHGLEPRGLFSVTAISGDGRRLVATGTTQETLHSSGSVLIEIVPDVTAKPVR